MSIKLLVRQGGAAAEQPDLANLDDDPREGVPIFDGDQALVELAQRWEQGTAGRGQFTYVDVDGTATYRFRPHVEVKLIEDASGDDVILGWGRIEGGNDTGRRTPTGIGGDEVQHNAVQVMDCNLDLRGLPFRNGWSRPAENSWVRLQALEAAKLNGSASSETLRRATTDITVANFAGGHLVDASDPVDLDAVEYPPGTHVNDVMADILEQWGRGWGVTIHHAGGSHKCLLVQAPDDFASFTSPLRISDQRGDWDPEDLTAPTLEPIWRRANGKTSDNSETISGLISLWSGTTDEPRHLYVETGEAPEDWETWVDVYNDDLARTPTQAERRAGTILNDRKRAYVTDQPSILLLPEQVHLITAGQSIEVKSVVLNQGPDKHSFVTKRIVEIAWEPAPDGRWYAHLSLERPRNTRPRAGGSQPGSTTPRFPPTCTPTPDDVVTVLSDSSVGDWGSTTTAGACWGGDAHRSIGASGQHSPTVVVTAGDFIRASLNFREQTGDDAWENNTNYDYDADLVFEKAGGGLPLVVRPIVNQLYHNAGCINVTHSITEEVPAGGYDRAHVRINSRLGGYRFNGTIATVDEADIPDNDPDCVDGGPGGSSPFVPRYDDPRFDNDDQHLITKLERRAVNTSGGVLDEGDVVVPDATADDPSVTTTTDAATTEAMVGVVTEGGADGDTVRVMWWGSILRAVNVDGAASPGDYLYTSTTAGAADVSGTRTAGAVGRVIAVDADDLTTFVLWWGVPDTAGSGGVSDHGALSGLADDDHLQYLETTGGGGDVVQDHPAAGSTETLDLADGNVHVVTLTADCTLTLAGATNGEGDTMGVILIGGAGAPWDVTWPASVAWAGGAAPDPPGAVDEWILVTLLTVDGGTVWRGDAAATTAGGGGGHDITEDGGSALATRGKLDFRHGLDVTDDSGSDSTRVAVDESELDHALIGGTSPDIPKTIVAAKGDLIGASANDTPALIAAGTEGQFPVTRAAATPGVAFETVNGGIDVVIDGGGATIATGVKADIRVPFALELVRASLLADASGSIVVDIWRDTYANFPPTAGDSITAAAKPTLSGAAKAEDATLTGWSKSCPEGSVLRVNVDSVSGLQRVTLELRYKRA